MERKLNQYVRLVKVRLIFFFAFLIALFLSLVVLPLVLLISLGAAMMTGAIMLKARRKPSIELLPAEDGPVVSTQDAELEIIIDNLQKNAKSNQISRGNS